MRRSVLAKAAETAALREQTLIENAAVLAAAGDALRSCGRVLALGNGGSATDAMDVVADFRALAHEFQKIAQIRDPLERLKRAGLTYIEFGLNYPNHYRLMFMTPHPPHTPEIEASKGNPEEDAYAFLKVVVGECVKADLFRREFTDVEAVSQLLWAGVHGVVSLQVAKGEEDWVDWKPVRQLAAMMVDVQLTGLLKDERKA